jgi:hypothetical protein
MSKLQAPAGQKTIANMWINRLNLCPPCHLTQVHLNGQYAVNDATKTAQESGE